MVAKDACSQIEVAASTLLNGAAGAEARWRGPRAPPLRALLPRAPSALAAGAPPPRAEGEAAPASPKGGWGVKTRERARACERACVNSCGRA
eukprot:6205715-Pleurochrysis_carterae.AAC.1